MNASPLDFQNGETIKLGEKTNFIQLRFVENSKAYFHSTKSTSSKRRAYVIKGDILRVEKTEGEWAYCSFTAKTTTKGWIKVSDLNSLNY